MITQEAREKFVKTQKDMTEARQIPFFMPESGQCPFCASDIIERLIKRGKDGTELVTGCPCCNATYCD